MASMGREFKKVPAIPMTDVKTTRVDDTVMRTRMSKSATTMASACDQPVE